MSFFFFFFLLLLVILLLLVYLLQKEALLRVESFVQRDTLSLVQVVAALYYPFSIKKLAAAVAVAAAGQWDC